MPTVASPTAHLLPAYDEYTIAYKDHRAILDPQSLKQVIAGNGIVILIDGHIVGTWKRILKKDTVIITPTLFASLSQGDDQSLTEAVQRYGTFLELKVILG